jgi:hypothetical protein
MTISRAKFGQARGLPPLSRENVQSKRGNFPIVFGSNQRINQENIRRYLFNKQNRERASLIAQENKGIAEYNKFLDIENRFSKGQLSFNEFAQYSNVANEIKRLYSKDLVQDILPAEYYNYVEQFRPLTSSERVNRATSISLFNQKLKFGFKSALPKDVRLSLEKSAQERRSQIAELNKAGVTFQEKGISFKAKMGGYSSAVEQGYIPEGGQYLIKPVNGSYQIFESLKKKP